MTEICPERECTGCMACSAICGHKAIDLVYDELGFRKPYINPNLCTNCNMCRKVCPSIDKPEGHPVLEIYAAVYKDNEILKQSSSGGLAAAISIEFIKNGGVVYCCSGKDILHIHHFRCSKVEDISYSQGSFYVQSDLTEVYKDIKKDLLSEKKVLFISIPCQVAGVRKFLLKNYDNLFTIDLVCHGAASEKMLKDNIENYCKRYKVASLHNVKFRKKGFAESGKHYVQYGFYFEIDGKEYNFPAIKDPFMLCYSKNLLFRDSCYLCKYACINRMSDITLGDFWGLNDAAGLSDQLGVSLCLTHTEKGNLLFEGIKNKILFIKRPIEEATKGNPQLITPTKPNAKLLKFRELLIKRSLIKANETVHRKLIIRNKISHILDVVGLKPVIRIIKR